MMRHPRSIAGPILNYGLAFVSVGLAYALTLATWPALRSTPLALFFAAVMAAAWRGGLGPGLVAMGLSAAFGRLAFLEASGVRGGWIAIAAFLAVSLFIVALGAARRRAEAFERAERKRFQAAMTSIGDAVIATDSEARVRFMNPVAEELTGWAFVEAEGKRLEEVFVIVNESTREPVPNPVAKVVETGIVQGLANHTILIARGGVERPIDDSAAPIRGDDGALSGVVLVFRDISIRKLAETAQARLAAIVESSDDAIVGKTLDGVIRSWNSGAERVFGYTAAEAVGQSITLIIPPDRLDEERGILERLRRGERINHFETVRLAKSGRQLDISLTVSPIRDEYGHVIGASKVARDVTDRKAADWERARLAESLGLALDAADLGTWEWDPESDRAVLSDRAAMIYGIEPGRSCTRDWLRGRIHPDDRDRAREEARRAVAERSDYDIEYRLDRADGGPSWVAVRGRGVFGPDGRLARMTGIVQDITARKNAEQALLESEARYRAIVEATPECVKLVAPDGTLLQMNRAGLEMIEGDDSALGNCVYDVIAPEFRAAYAAFNDRVCRGIAGELEFDIIGRHGTRRHMETTAVPLPAPQGGFTQLAVTRDVTARKRDAAILREKDERLKLLIENTRDYAVVISDPAGTILEWQGAAERIAGYSADEAVGRDAGLLFTPEDRAEGRPEAEMNRAALEGRADDRRWHLRKDGSRFFADGVMMALNDDSGKLRGFGKVFKDATREKQAEEATRRRAAQLQKLAGIANRIHSAQDVQSVVRVVAEEARNLVGARSSAIQVVLDPDHPQPIQIVSNPDAGPTPDVGLSAPLVGRNGRSMGQIRVAGRSEGEFDEDDGAILAQLAQLSAIAVENARLYEELRYNDGRKDEFLAMLAHELRNPLAAISNAVKLTSRTREQEHIDWSMGVIVRQMRHLSRLIDDLMDVSRINRGKIELRRGILEATPILESAAATVKGLIDERGHSLELDIDRGNLWVDADPTRLEQVVVNLLNNAAKYSDNGGQIRLSAGASGGEVAIAVKDRGVGIPPEKLPEMFELFAQGDRSLARSEGGLGIGLTVVKKLVEMHGGTVQARSEGPGKGSEFTIRLPAASRSAGPHAPDADEPPPSGPRRILVVDDNVDTAKGMARLLTLIGHEVATAHSGPEAIEAARAFLPAIILLDIGLPGMSGYEVAAQLRREEGCRDAVIVAVSGYGQDEDRRRSREAGFDFHLVKPLDHDALLTLLSAGGK